VTKVHTEWQVDRKDIEGIPICIIYKYLGASLTPKLSCIPQLNNIKKKAAHLLVKFSPYLKNISAEGCTGIFLTFIMPLFNTILVLLNQEPGEAHRARIEKTKNILFKQCLGLKKRTSSKLVEDMLRVNLKEKAHSENEVSLVK